jgi:hypothetical protein
MHAFEAEQNAAVEDNQNPGTLRQFEDVNIVILKSL